jgi:hypothetical protein
MRQFAIILPTLDVLLPYSSVSWQLIESLNRQCSSILCPLDKSPMLFESSISLFLIIVCLVPLSCISGKTYLSATSLCSSIRSGITYPIEHVVGIFTVIIIAGSGTQPISSVIGADRTSILIVDLHLEE